MNIKTKLKEEFNKYPDLLKDVAELSQRRPTEEMVEFVISESLEPLEDVIDKILPLLREATCVEEELEEHVRGKEECLAQMVTELETLKEKFDEFSYAVSNLRDTYNDMLECKEEIKDVMKKKVEEGNNG